MLEEKEGRAVVTAVLNKEIGLSKNNDSSTMAVQREEGDDDQVAVQNSF